VVRFVLVCQLFTCFIRFIGWCTPVFPAASAVCKVTGAGDSLFFRGWL
jgi:hypothetical protein